MRALAFATFFLLSLVWAPAASAQGACDGYGSWETYFMVETDCTANGMWRQCAVWVRAPPVGGPAVCVESVMSDLVEV